MTNFDDLIFQFKEVLIEIIKIMGANCWRLAIVNSHTLLVVKSLLPSINLRISGMCCYYKSPVIMFGILEKVSDSKSDLFALNSHVKKMFVCSVKNIEDRAYINIENKVLSVPAIHGLNDAKNIKNLRLINETPKETDAKWITEKAELVQAHMSHRGFSGYSNNGWRNLAQRDNNELLIPAKQNLEFSDFLGIQVEVFNYFINGNKVVYDTSIGAIVHYGYTAPQCKKFPVPGF